MKIMLQHSAIRGILTEIVPIFECLLIDYNACIHYVLQKTITELNEILYFTYQRENGIRQIISSQLIPEPSEFNLNLNLNIDDLESLVKKYDIDYQIGTTYQKVREKLSEENIINIVLTETLNYTRNLISKLNRGYLKKVYIAFDGVPSVAKMKEQKNRRYIAAYINKLKEDIIKKHKIGDKNIAQIDLFYYRSMICVGTNFMDKIQEALYCLNLDLDLEISTTNSRGEGEKKIIHALDKYGDYGSYCIMSPDSDMFVLVGILQNDPKFSGKIFYNFRIDYQNSNKYQFFDMKKVVSNLQHYYSSKLNMNITMDKMLDIFFMLVVFGNDFLPKLEPLDITQDFDFVCETCLKISMSGTRFIINGILNYEYLLTFFKEVNKSVAHMAIEKSLNEKYYNFQKLCRRISINSADLKNMHHPSLREVKVTYHNFTIRMESLVESYRYFIKFMKNVYIRRDQIWNLYKDMHGNPDDSYFLLVLPRLLKFPGSENETNSYQFFRKLVEYIICKRDFQNIKLRIKLTPRRYTLPTKFQKAEYSAYVSEMEKLNQSLEPYRSMFRIKNITLVTFDLYNNRMIDLRKKYYNMYVGSGMTREKINSLVLEYLVGIEWLYQYYILGKHMELSGWYYNQTQPPLIEDIAKYLENNHSNLNGRLDSIIKNYPENNMEPNNYYLYVTPNEYTRANVSPNLSDVIHLIDGNGAVYLSKCQIKWHEYKVSTKY
ncbi:MAG: hypothetical protein QXW79_00375 [Thermoplasmata archaeon]